MTCNNFGKWVTVPRVNVSFCFPPPTEFVGDRRLFFGPPGNFTEGVALHVALKIGMKGIFNPSEDGKEIVRFSSVVYEKKNHKTVFC